MIDGHANLIAAWGGFLAGALSGLAAGVFFHDPAWLGGYDGWRRRLLRLGHIACFGLGLLNLAFVATLPQLPVQTTTTLSGWLLIAGLATMTPTCWLAAFRPAARYAFAIPVGCVAAGTTGVLVGLLA